MMEFEEALEDDITATLEEVSTKVTEKRTKVNRRRSIEEYIAKKRWKEANEDLVDLYDAECY